MEVYTRRASRCKAGEVCRSCGEVLCEEREHQGGLLAVGGAPDVQHHCHQECRVHFVSVSAEKLNHSMVDLRMALRTTLRSSRGDAVVELLVVALEVADKDRQRGAEFARVAPGE